MKRQDGQGSFIALIWTLMATVKQITSRSALIHPRADAVADLLLWPVLSRSMQRRQAEEARLNPRVFRFSSVDNATSPCWRSSPPKLLTR